MTFTPAAQSAGVKLVEIEVRILNRCSIAFLLIYCVVPFSTAKTLSQGEGVVTLGGEIVESACGIDSISADQAIEMKPESIAKLINSGQGKEHWFEIRLINCSLSRFDPRRPEKPLPDWQYLQITFDGDSDMEGRSFATYGVSKGVALQIMDEFGNISIPGLPMPQQFVKEGATTLRYQVRLVGNGSAMNAGTHNAAVRFKIDYY